MAPLTSSALVSATLTRPSCRPGGPSRAAGSPSRTGPIATLTLMASGPGLDPQRLLLRTPFQRAAEIADALHWFFSLAFAVLPRTVSTGRSRVTPGASPSFIRPINIWTAPDPSSAAGMLTEHSWGEVCTAI